MNNYTVIAVSFINIVGVCNCCNISGDANERHSLALIR